MSKINQEAKKERHRKLFEGHYQSKVGRLWFYSKRGLKKAFHSLRPSSKRLSHFMHPLDHLPAPKRLFSQLSFWSIGLLILTSVNVSNAAYQGGEGVGAEYLSLDIQEQLITDEEGFLIKSMPLEGEAVYDQNRSEIVTYEVQAGDTLSVIAYRYGLGSSSIRYLNKLSGDHLKIGQELEIPPKDGYYVEVSSGDSLAALVKKHKGDHDATAEFNNISDDSELIAGDKILIIDGQPYYTYVASTPSYSAPSQLYYDIPANSQGWIRPTQGRITQGYRAGHYAYDVADTSKPPILAAASGVVVKASSGTWGGGYGNHVIIDHGNGYQTLYAHAEVLYVNVGDTVSQGQVIAKMGATGRVYGRTGIHLHFEITYQGRKLNPSVMGVW